MGPRVDGDRVRLGCERRLAELLQRVPAPVTLLLARQPGVRARGLRHASGISELYVEGGHNLHLEAPAAVAEAVLAELALDKPWQPELSLPSQETPRA